MSIVPTNILHVSIPDLADTGPVALTVSANGSLMVSDFELHPTDTANVFNIVDKEQVVPVFLEYDGISKVAVSLRGYTYLCTVYSHKQQELLAILSASPAAASRVTKIVSPMPGLLKHVLVGVGEDVKKGATLFVLEAMKMENAIKSPVSGKVTELQIAEGEAYEKGTLLCLIHPNA
jgi:biotin carboxyl carrier protein